MARCATRGPRPAPLSAPWAGARRPLPGMRSVFISLCPQKGLELDRCPAALGDRPHRLTEARADPTAAGGRGWSSTHGGPPRSTSLGAVQGPPCLALDTKRRVSLGCVPCVSPRPLRGREPVHLRRLRGPKPKFRAGSAFTERLTHRTARANPGGTAMGPPVPRGGAGCVLHLAGQQGSPEAAPGPGGDPAAPPQRGYKSNAIGLSPKPTN